MCACDTIRYVCGHHHEVAGIRQCPLTLASENFKPCSIVGDWPIYVNKNCTACARVEWNNDILKEEEQRRLYGLGNCDCSEPLVDKEWQRSRSPNTRKGKQNARQVLPENHHEGVSQNVHETVLANKEQRWVLNERQTNIKIIKAFTHWGPMTEVSNEPAVETDMQNALRQENSMKMIQWGDMEPIPYYPEQHATTAVRSEYTRTKTGVSVAWEFSPHPASSNTSTAVECLSYTSREGALLAELLAGELHQRDELEEDTIHYTPVLISVPMSRLRSESCPPILFSHEGSMLQVLEE